MWNKWKKISNKVTSLQAFVIFTVIYVLIIIPISFIMKKNFSGVFRIKIDKNKKSYWVKKEKFLQDISWSRKQ